MTEQDLSALSQSNSNSNQKASTDSLLHENIFNSSFSIKEENNVALDKAGLSISQVQIFSEQYRQAKYDVERQQMEFQMSIGMQSIFLMAAITIIDTLLVSGIMSLVPADMKVGWKILTAVGLFVAGVYWPGGFIMKKFFKNYLHKGLKKAKDHLKSMDKEALVVDNLALQQELFAFFKQNQPDLFDRMSPSYTAACNNFRKHIEKKEFGVALCDLQEVFRAIPDLDQKKYRQLIEHYPELKLASLNEELKNRL